MSKVSSLLMTSMKKTKSGLAPGGCTYLHEVSPFRPPFVSISAQKKCCIFVGCCPSIFFGIMLCLFVWRVVAKSHETTWSESIPGITSSQLSQSSQPIKGPNKGKYDQKTSRFKACVLWMSSFWTNNSTVKCGGENVSYNGCRFFVSVTLEQKSLYLSKESSQLSHAIIVHFTLCPLYFWPKMYQLFLVWL